MLVRMAHRGGCGCDPYSGDGAGILTGMPDGFLRKAVEAELGKELPPLGQYAAGVIFFPKEAGAIAACKAAFEKQIAAQGLGLVGWRPLPVDNSELGATSLESEPHSEMLLVSPKEGTAPATSRASCTNCCAPRPPPSSTTPRMTISTSTRSTRRPSCTRAS